MPLYEFYCPKCRRFFEHIVAYTLRDYQKCDVCNGTLEPQMSVPAKRVTGFAGKAGGLPSDWGAHEM